jgi:hypothetical protein
MQNQMRREYQVQDSNLRRHRIRCTRTETKRTELGQLHRTRPTAPTVLMVPWDPWVLMDHSHRRVQLVLRRQLVLMGPRGHEARLVPKDPQRREVPVVQLAPRHRRHLMGPKGQEVLRVRLVPRHRRSQTALMDQSRTDRSALLAQLDLLAQRDPRAR